MSRTRAFTLACILASGAFAAPAMAQEGEVQASLRIFCGGRWLEAEADGREPVCNPSTGEVQAEVVLGDAALLDKPILVVANKMDEEIAEENLATFKKNHDVAISPISCLSDEGIPELLRRFLDEVTKIEEAEKRAAEAAEKE